MVLRVSCHKELISAGRHKLFGEPAPDIHLPRFRQPHGAHQDFPGQAHGVVRFHHRLFRLGDLGLGPERIQVGDLAGLEKGIGEFGKLLALLQGFPGYLEIFLGLDQAVEGLGHRIGHFLCGALDLLLLGLGTDFRGLGIVMGF